MAAFSLQLSAFDEVAEKDGWISRPSHSVRQFRGWLRYECSQRETLSYRYSELIDRGAVSVTVESPARQVEDAAGRGG